MATLFNDYALSACTTFSHAVGDRSLLPDISKPKSFIRLLSVLGDIFSESASSFLVMKLLLELLTVIS
jgi:hypothetical protein